MSYTHLTAEVRYQIAILHRKGVAMTEIATLVGRHKSTISREIHRNSGRRGYRPKQAQEIADQRRSKTRNSREISDKVWQKVFAMLRLDWSPEQISGRLLRTSGELICHETIYRRIYADKAGGGELFRHLRCQRVRRKRYGSGRSKRGRIPNRVGIEHRSSNVESRAILGHWEGDTMIGRNHKGALVTHVERKSRFTKIGYIPKKTAAAVAKITIEKLRRFVAVTKTITYDNGLEFSAHATIAGRLKAKTFFANPYSSWERGTNENTNGLIRQYLPKKTNFELLSRDDVQWIEDRLNDRPRKCLDYETPREVMKRGR